VNLAEAERPAPGQRALEFARTVRTTAAGRARLGALAMTETPPRNAYARRVERVVAHICGHLEEDLSLERLSEVAGFSKYHFHRQFAAATGFTVAQFVRLTRLKRAAYQLAFDRSRSVLQVALDAGFGSPEAFARAFKELHEQTPSEFRASPLWAAWAAKRPLPSPTSEHDMKPSIVDFPETRVAVLEHRGPQEARMASVTRFIAWRRSSKDSPVATHRTFGIAYDDPATTEPERFRFDICGELTGPLSPNTAGIIEKVIPAGRCAVARHIGSTDALGPCVRALYAEWLPQSGEQLRDFPLFFHYIARMPAVPEHEQVTDIYVPLR
jgi:AraC family transcriptional regulator